MAANIPPLTPIASPTTICGHCSRDNYGSLDSTCPGCGSPIARRPTSPPPPDKKRFPPDVITFGRVPVPPPPPPSVSFAWS